MSNNTSEITVRYSYDENGEDIEQILRASLLLFIEGEVIKKCSPNS